MPGLDTACRFRAIVWARRGPVWFSGHLALFISVSHSRTFCTLFASDNCSVKIYKKKMEENFKQQHKNDTVFTQGGQQKSFSLAILFIFCSFFI